ncbi:hypothetical protein B0H13DRAFT_2060182 [Mycena leptocephala]|nr:hypothetical protein B0H13DRAFT_2060182 [Mycena leptocephala]
MDSDLEPATDNGHTPSTAFLPLNHDQRRNTNSSIPQIELLRRIDQRQAAAVPATSSSTWGALLRSRVSETIQPKVDRWRSGLDALLVFLGLFSAIVTAFLVDSLTGLQQDEAASTNELLANLTEILIQLSAGRISQPGRTECSTQLVLLSVAALAVACRGYLNMVTLSTHRRAVDKLIDIHNRWKPAEKMLGLRSNIFSNILSLELLPIPIAAASSLSLFFIAGFVYPDSSPFQSTLVRVVRKIFQPPKIILDAEGILLSTYHEIVQATHEDETLDSAAAALVATIETQPGFHLLNDLAQAARSLFEPDFIVARNVLQFVPLLSEKFDNLHLILMAAKTPAVVIAAAHDRLTQPDSFSRYSDPFVTGLLVLEASLGAENHLLAELCSACIWYAKEQVESGYPAGFYEDVLEMTERAKERFPPSPTSPVVFGDALITKARAFILRSIDLGTEYTAQESVTS